ncbi:uncharacterized protein [Ptychodera flava]|uniref:uncharacterized protein n=1 Tax=Ptychodera flava TaxID=63121 RepID=UPI003969F30C
MDELGAENEDEHPATEQQGRLSADDGAQISDDGRESPRESRPCEEGAHMCADACVSRATEHLGAQSLPGLPSSRWKTENINRLNFRSCPRMIDTDIPVDEIIWSWLMENATNGDDDDCLPSYPASQDTDVSVAAAGMSTSHYRKLLSRHVKEGLKEDSFLEVLFHFAAKNNLKYDRVTSLAKAVATLDKRDEFVKNKPKYQTVMLRWVDIIRECRSQNLCEASIDHLAADLIELAANEANFLVLTRIRDATERKLVLCGRDVSIKCNVEARAVHGAGLLQVISFSNDTNLMKETSLSSDLLSEMAHGALVMSPITAFGNDFFKTVYQICIHSVYSREEKTVNFDIFLVKCQVSVDTLANMNKCPLVNTFMPSYIMHQRLQGLQLHSPHLLSLLYQAFKAVVLTFKGAEGRQTDWKYLPTKK